MSLGLPYDRTQDTVEQNLNIYLGVVVRTCNPSDQEVKSEREVFKACLSYVVNGGQPERRETLPQETSQGKRGWGM